MLFGVVRAASAGNESRQSWNEVDITGSVHGVGVIVPTVARLDSRLPNPRLLGTGAMLDLSLPWRLTLTGGYLSVHLPRPSPSTVSVPLVALSITVSTTSITIVDRNRLEKLIGVAGSPVRYRNRLLVDVPLDKSFSGWHAFADDEIFWNRGDDSWVQNRVQIGAGAPLTRRLFLDLYFLRRDLGRVVAPTFVVGTALRVKLPSLTHDSGRIVR